MSRTALKGGGTTQPPSQQTRAGAVSCVMGGDLNFSLSSLDRSHRPLWTGHTVLPGQVTPSSLDRSHRPLWTGQTVLPRQLKSTCHYPREGHGTLLTSQPRKQGH
eukprot:347902-Chlamydomonas_euryale.AAC.1